MRIRAAAALGLALISLCLLAGTGSAVAQVRVGISLKRPLYMIYEPIICTVSITNLTGGELALADTPRHQWFGFQIETLSGRPVPPNDLAYRNEPLVVEPGQTVRRSVNLTPMFPLGEFGGYRIRATVFAAAFNRYFSSPPLNVEISEGRTIWEQTVGVPPHSGQEGKTRHYALLTFRLSSYTMLYLRASDPDRGRIYCTTQLGKFLAYGSPQVRLDRNNEIHILHNMAPKEFLYSHFGLDGKPRSQQAYQDWGTRPVLVPTTEGGVSVLGGTAFDPKAVPTEKLLPGLGDHPPDLPKPEPTPTPKKQEDVRPENLLSR